MLISASTRLECVQLISIHLLKVPFKGANFKCEGGLSYEIDLHLKEANNNAADGYLAKSAFREITFPVLGENPVCEVSPSGVTILPAMNLT